MHSTEESSSAEQLSGSRDNGDFERLRKSLEPGRITLVAYPIVLGLIFAFAVSGIFVDKYYALSTSTLMLNSPGAFSQSFKVPRSVVRSTAVDIETVNESGSVTTTGIKYEPGNYPLDDADFEYFREYLISMEYTQAAWKASRVLAYLTTGLSSIALCVQLVFRLVPSTHAFKPESFISSVSWKNSLPVWLILSVCILSLVRTLLVTSIAESLVCRWALASIRSSSDTAAWQSFLKTFNEANPREYQMLVLQGLGKWYNEQSGKWAFSIWSITVVILLSMLIFFAVFYSDIKIVRYRLSVDNSMDLLTDQIKSLPVHSKILPLWVSLLFTSSTLLLTAVVGHFVRNNGRSSNRLPWVAKYDDERVMQTVDDLILSHTMNFWFDPSTIVDVLVLGWIPLALIVAIGSIDRISCLSKISQTIGIVYLLRIPSILSTVYPTSYSVLQKPHCYDEDPLAFWKGFTNSEYCNDMIYSGHTVLIIVPAFVVIMMIIYGPYWHKTLPIVGIVVGALVSAAVVIVGRFHYTVDVLLTIMIASLVCIMNAPAWKAIFSYSKYQLRIGSATSIRKVAPLLEEACDRVVSITKSRLIDPQQTRWDLIDQKMSKLRQLIETAAKDVKAE